MTRLSEFEQIPNIESVFDVRTLAKKKLNIKPSSASVGFSQTSYGVASGVNKAGSVTGTGKTGTVTSKTSDVGSTAPIYEAVTMPAPDINPKNLGKVLGTMKKVLDTYQGVTGDKRGLDRVVRFRDIYGLDPEKFGSIRSTSFSSRITRITGNIIRTGKIESYDSRTFLDLDNDRLVFNGKITYDSSMPGFFMGKDTDGIYKINIESNNYVSGSHGSGFKLTPDLLEVGNIYCRGVFRTAVFQKDTVSAIGGDLLLRPADVLDADMSATDTTLTIKGDETFAVGDFLRMKTESYDEWFEVTNIASAPTYTVTRDKGDDYETNPAWYKGTAIVNYGASGDGGILMTSCGLNAPHINIFDHAGAPWDTLSGRVRIGNLNGFLGYSTDLYGIAVGETDKYLTYDTTNGLRVKGNVIITGGSGILSFTDAGALAALDEVTAGEINVSYLSAINADMGTITAGNITLDSSGFLRTSGKDNYADTTAGIFLGYDTDAYKLNIGDSSSYVKWTGTGLIVRGIVNIYAGSYAGNSISVTYTDAKCTDADADETATHESLSTKYLDGSVNRAIDDPVEFNNDIEAQAGSEYACYYSSTYKGGLYGATNGIYLKSTGAIYVEKSIYPVGSCALGTTSTRFSSMCSSAINVSDGGNTNIGSSWSTFKLHISNVSDDGGGWYSYDAYIA